MKVHNGVYKMADTFEVINLIILIFEVGEYKMFYKMANKCYYIWNVNSRTEWFQVTDCEIFSEI